MNISSVPRTTVCVLIAIGTLHICPMVFAETGESGTTDLSRVNAQKQQPDTATLNSLAHTFHQIHVSANKMKKVCQSISDEFNRTSLKILTFDEYINQYIDGKPVAYNEQLYPYGFQNIGNTSTTAGTPLPPRREYVSHFVTESNSLLTLISQKIDDAGNTMSSAGFDQSINAMKKNLVDAKESLRLTSKTLSDLSAADPYDKDAISKVNSDLNSKLSELDSACKLTMKMVAASVKKR